MFGNNEGPTTIPAHSVRVPERTTCDGCRYFREDRIGNVCGGFGARLGPVRTSCVHPDAMHYYDVTRPGEQLPLRTPDRGTPRVISRDAHALGHSHGTPEWCPYLKEKKQ